ncbi:unnamed protein product [Pneumocystis jirovecii]|uniref:tRNA (guanine(9)-N1)-methyltransferase n=2 Tax=Pneumocystis jirovecii TaxID=42068 RepID=L0PE03_PNEJI|nr:tRNA (guanine(9)-N(1))-methyltransferase [Pneumocystis jirovecii RU7]KTW26534.1 hypothetical protein T551_03451 [Pneumocystis jirovecii RU7]CCJ30593.1 unnamed protein product [Pneumocystis jirovecii]
MSDFEVKDEKSCKTFSDRISTQETKIEEPTINFSKKMMKKKLKQKKWEETKAEWRKRKKEKAKIKKIEKRKKLEEMKIPFTKLKKNQTPSNIKVIIDCEFDDKMVDKEIVSLSSQLTRCYSDNRRSSFPVQLYVTSFGGRLEERMRTILKNQHMAWQGIEFLGENYTALHERSDFKENEFIYLTADSENTINELDKNKIYIIGGIVDKNRYKNLCLNKAKSQNIWTAKLPIENYIEMASRKVLTINQVLEIMHQWIEIRDWEKAFLNVIPPRKLPQSKKANKPDQSFENLEINHLEYEDIGDLSEEAIKEINE